MTAQPRLRPWMIVSAAWIVPAAFAALDRYAQGQLNGYPTTTRDILWAGGDWLLYALLTPFVFMISARWPLARPHLARRAALHVAISLLFCVAWATVGRIFQIALTRVFDPQSLQKAMATGQFWPNFLHQWVGWIFTTLPFGVAVYLCVVGVEHAVRYFMEARDRDVQLARLSAQLSTARFAALQAQLNPHFLFNSLNTVTVLVRDGDQSGATHVIEQLSDVLRRTLNRRTTNEVTLEEELDLVRRYLEVERARFSDRLRPELHVDASLLSAAIPSFSVQHLVENAIRHGIARRTDAGRVVISARRDGDMLEVTIEDDGAGTSSNDSFPAGHGLSNTIERLGALYGDGASLALRPLSPHGTVAHLRVPYHEIALDTRPSDG